MKLLGALHKDIRNVCGKFQSHRAIFDQVINFKCWTPIEKKSFFGKLEKKHIIFFILLTDDF